MRALSPLTAALLLAACRGSAPGVAPVSPAPPPHGVVGIEPAHLAPDFWVRRAPAAGTVVLTPAAIAAQNRALLDRDSSLLDLERLPARLSGAQVRHWVTRLSQAPSRQLFDERGDSVGAARIAELVAAVQPATVPDDQPARFALVTRRADMRTFPTTLRVFSSRGNTDIDRWQETALFPGEPVVIVHESRDGQWWFVLSRHYAAWTRKEAIAEGPRDVVLGYARREPFLVVTGATVRTVYTPEQPAVSDLQLDMGVRVPLVAAPEQTVNGQNAYVGYAIELPVRTARGGLTVVPAVLPRTADVSQGYLPLTAEGLVRQSFKFLGERYGWGHGYNGRDCSGFVGEIYRSFGVDLPRNTGDQATSPALNRLTFAASDSHEARLAAVRQAHVGDMIHIPGHTMMVIGRLNGDPYIIHDVTGVSFRGADGAVVRVPLNAVSVTPLVPLASGDATWVDRMTAIVRIRP